MGAAFEGYIPDVGLKLLKAGDIIIVQTLDRFASWVIMYVTQSDVSHVALYLGDRRICHSNPSVGVTSEPVEVLFRPNARLLPCVWKMPDATRAKIPDEVAESWEGRPYASLLVFLKGLSVLSAHNWPVFRWQLFVDVAAALFVIDLPFLLLLHHAVVSWLIPAYALVVGLNALRWKLMRPRMSELFFKPNDALHMIVASGGAVVADGVDVHRQTTLLRRNKRSGAGPVSGCEDVVVLPPDGSAQSVPPVLLLEFADRDGSSVTISAPGMPSMGASRYGPPTSHQ
jgi:hypothetical protein